MFRRKTTLVLLAALMALTSIGSVMSADWPMWRYDSSRTAASPEELDTSDLQLHWKIQLSEPMPAWDSQQEVYCYGGSGYPVMQRLSFDIAYQPVVMENTMYVGSMNEDCLIAFNLKTGEERWRFFTNGPVRFAPVAKYGKIYFGSDDGYFYCVNPEGELLWKIQGGPAPRKVMGNDRMMSIWPVRGAPVIPTAREEFLNPAYLDWLETKMMDGSEDFRIATGNDDAEENYCSGDMDISSSDLEIGREHTDVLDYQAVGLRFTNPFYTVKTDGAVSGAYIQFTVDETKGGDMPLTVRISAEMSGASDTFDSDDFNLVIRKRTETYVDWSISSWTEKGACGPAQKSPDLSPIINELVTAPDWVSGSPITFLIEPLTGEGIRCAESLDGDGVGPILQIDSDSLLESNHTRPESFSTINPAWLAWKEGLDAPDAKKYQLADGNADVEENKENGSLYKNSSDTELMHDGREQVIGYEFSCPYYSLSPGASVNSASIQFTVDETKGGDMPLQVRITGDMSGRKDGFVNSYDISSRERTSNEVIWDIPAWTKVGDAGDEQKTPDLTAIVNEILAGSNYTQGAPIVLIFEYVSGEGIRCAESKDGNGKGAILNLDYPEGALEMRHDTEPEKYLNEEVTDTNTIYFAAGSYPFEGSFVYALDAETGEVKWCNDGVHMYFTENPHGGSEGYNGNGPQGYLCTGRGGKLLVPNGRNQPACFDRETGALLFHKLGATNGVSKGDGGYFCSSLGDKFFTNRMGGSKAFSLEDGSGGGSGSPLLDEYHLMILAGSTEFSGGKVFGYLENDFDYTVKGGEFAYTLDARPAGLLAANGYLIATDRAGNIYGFGEGDPENGVQVYENAPEEPGISWLSYGLAANTLQMCDYRNGTRGHAIVAGIITGEMVEAMAAISDLTITVFEPNPGLAKIMRNRVAKTGKYGHRIQVVEEKFGYADAPSYCAQLITSEQIFPAQIYFLDALYETRDWRYAFESMMGFYKEVYRCLRPYGGKAFIGGSLNYAKKALLGQENCDIRSNVLSCTIQKPGKLPGSADWTHQHANPQQTTLSADELVKLPMGILWFGGSMDNTNDDILPRHGHGPSPQVVGGRYYIQGRDVLRCVDIYTGRVLWQRKILNLGQFSDYTDHQAGQLAVGDNYISTEDAVYVLAEHADNDWPFECLVLDPATGIEMNRFALPNMEGFGAIIVYEDYLIATANPMIQDTHGYDNDGNPFPLGSGWIYQDSDPMVGVGGMGTWNGSHSEKFYVMDRKTGEIQFGAEAEYGFFNNSIVLGNDKLFVMDRVNYTDEVIEERMIGKKRGSAPRSGWDDTLKPAILSCYNVKTGQLKWQHSSDEYELFGSWLAYSEKYDVLIECQRNSRDYYEPHKGSHRMSAWRGASGQLLWSEIDRFYWGGPVMLRDDMVITQSGNDMGAVNLNTGEPYLVPSGITGQMGDFAGFKRYGCGTGIACTNMMIFRSGNAGYYDLNTNSGTGNWGGFKTGCTINLMPANGLIVAPEYTRTCGCSYQFQTSCAMIHRDDVEQWACNKNLGAQYANQGGRLLNVGFNFGAVGDRVDDDGIFWMEYPFGEPEFGYNYQIPVDVTVSGEEVNYFRHHMLTVDGEGLNWVASSGVEGASSISIDMVRGDEASPACAYDVYLYFVEPNVKAIGGDRVFSASVNGNSVGTLDLAAQAGPRKIVVKKLTGIIIDDTLTIDLSATAGKTLLSGVGVECQN